MSFSGEVKAELADVEPKARHCQVGELGAMLEVAGKPFFDAAAGESGLRIRTESPYVVRKVFTIADKAITTLKMMNGIRPHLNSNIMKESMLFG